MSTASPSTSQLPTAAPQRVPASFAQQRLWFIDQLGQDREVYNLSYAIQLHGNLNADTLRQAFAALAERHPSLRVSFASHEGQAVQNIAPRLDLPLEVTDLSSLSASEQATEVERKGALESRLPFDLGRGPLWRLRLLRLGDTEHLLLWTLHHTVCDQEGVEVLCRDLGRLYERALGNGAEPLASLVLEYAEYCRRQRERVQGDLLRTQLDFWRKRLGGSLPLLELPTSRPRPKVQTFHGAFHRFVLPAKLRGTVDDLARQENVSAFTVLLAVFQTLLHRYSTQEDILIGTTVSGRGPADGDGVVGFFVNNLVLRADLSGDPTFRELLGRAAAVVDEALAHQDIPFDTLVQEIRPQRDASHQPLFQVLFEHRRVAGDHFMLDGVRATVQPLHNGTSKFDLSVCMEERADGLHGVIEFNTDLFDREVIERLAGHYQMLLEGFTTDPEQRLSQVPLITAAEQQQMLVDWNRTEVDYPRDRRLHELVEDQVARSPDSVAVVFENRQFTYRELNTRANQLAHHLKTFGVGPEVLVGLCVERSPEMVVGLLGILKTGGGYVPLDPGFPPERLAYYVEDSRMPVLITQQALVDRLPPHQAKVIRLDTDGKQIATRATDNLPATAKWEHIAYVIYTSGSTGKPKGVQVLQGPVVNFLNWARREPGMTEHDILLAVTTLSFDIHVLEIWLTLTVGARVVIVGRDVAANGVELLQKLHETKATVLQATPATWRMLLAAGWEETPQLKIICGGEPMTIELAQQMLARGKEVWNGYGPTETTVYSTVHRVLPADGPIPIGHPIDNTQIYLLDRHLNPVPVGVSGELHLGGDGLARGYMNRPELTAEKFIPDPFSGKPGARMYKSGDLAKYRPDGIIECLGRIDHQVKIRGFRIELGEIETVLGQHPAVRSAVVVARKDESGADSLAAYVIPHAGQDAQPATLRKFLASRLPDYMVPAHFLSLEQFPLTPNGKIDRKALPAPDKSAEGPERPIVAPHDDAERDLLAVWEEVLKVKPISVTDNFFDLGGHSFLAAVLIAKIQQQLKHTLPLATLFAAPTVEKMARALHERLETGTGSSLVPLNEEGTRPPLFLIAGIGGHVFTYHKLARLLGADQPAYGVKAIGVEGTAKPLDRMEEIAANYLKEITARRPGPYVLAGYSVGGVVAYELATQLRAQGHKVDLLLVFDMLAPGYPKKLPVTRRLLIHAGNFARLSGAEKKAYLRERLQNIQGRIYRHLGLGARIAPVSAAIDPSTQDALRRVWAALDRASASYWPARKFDGRLLLFKAAEGFQWAATVFDDPLLGWGQWVTGGIETESLPGAHLEIFRDQNIERVAARIREAVGKTA